MTKSCERCGSPFGVRPNHPATRYCGRRCSALAVNERQRQSAPHPCRQCGNAVVGHRVFCSATCRTDFSRVRLTCAWCKREVLIRRGELHRQQYCSKSCAQRGQAETVTVPTLDAAFGSWFAGLTDGEGSFEFSVSEARSSARFTLALRDDDSATIALIRDTLGFGRVYQMRSNAHRSDGSPSHPKAAFRTVNVREAVALVQLFDWFPLRSKKHRDLAVWAEGVRLLQEGERDRTKLAALATKLRAARSYPV